MQAITARWIQTLQMTIQLYSGSENKNEAAQYYIVANYQIQ